MTTIEFPWGGTTNLIPVDEVMSFTEHGEKYVYIRSGEYWYPGFDKNYLPEMGDTIRVACEHDGYAFFVPENIEIKIHTEPTWSERCALREKQYEQIKNSLEFSRLQGELMIHIAFWTGVVSISIVLAVIFFGGN